MLKLVRNIAAVAAATSTCMLALPAQASLVFSAQYIESWSIEDSPDPTVDVSGDTFGFALTTINGAMEDINIDGIAVTYNMGIVNDPVDSGTYFSEIGTTAPLVPGIGESDLFFIFDTDAFGAGDFYQVTLDLDTAEGGANVPGSALFGSTLEIFYTDKNAMSEGFAEVVFGACENGAPEQCAEAFAIIEGAGPPGAVPAPMSLALFGLGLLGLGWRRSK